MTRLTSSTNATAVTQPHVPYVLFGDFDFVSGHVRVSSWDKSFTFGGNTYAALGKAVSVGDVTEEGGTASQKLEFRLAADLSMLSTALAEKYHGRDAILYCGWLNKDYELIDTPQIIWEGLMDMMVPKYEGTEATIPLTCENRLVRWQQKIGLMYTDEHQRLIDPTDAFFDQVATLSNKSVIWGGTEGTFRQNSDGSWG